MLVGQARVSCLMLWILFLIGCPSKYQNESNSKPRYDTHNNEALEETDLSLAIKLLGECISC